MPGSDAQGPDFSTDEEVLWRAGRALHTALPYAAFGVLLSAAGVHLWLVTDLPLDWVPLLLVPTGLLYGSAFLLDYASVTYTLTDERVYHESNFVFSTVNEISLDNVRSVSFEQSLVGRLLGFGQVVLTPHHPDQEQFVLKGIANPEHVAELVDEYRKAGGPADDSTGSTQSPITFDAPSAGSQVDSDDSSDHAVDPPMDVLQGSESGGTDLSTGKRTSSDSL